MHVLAFHLLENINVSTFFLFVLIKKAKSAKLNDYTDKINQIKRKEINLTKLKWYKTKICH